MATAELLFVAAEPREFAGFESYCAPVRRLQWPVEWAMEGTLGQPPGAPRVVLAAHGVGAERAAYAVEVALARRRFTAIVSVGFCGALAETLRVGDIFVATAVEHSHGRIDLKVPDVGRPHVSGPIASIARVAQTSGEKAALRRSGAAAVEMEAAGVAARAARFGMPVFCVRSVTDLANESFVTDLNAALRNGHFDVLELLRQSIRKPAAFRELLRLHRRSRLASRNLGDFLAACRF